MTDVIGYNLESLCTTIESYEPHMAAGGGIGVTICTEQLPTDDTIAQFVIDADQAGFTTSYPNCNIIDGVPTTYFEMTLKKQPASTSVGIQTGQLALILGFLAPVLLGGAIIWGVTQIKSVVNALLPLVIVVGVVTVAVVIVLAKPAEKVATAYIQSPKQKLLPQTTQRFLPATVPIAEVPKVTPAYFTTNPPNPIVEDGVTYGIHMSFEKRKDAEEEIQFEKSPGRRDKYIIKPWEGGYVIYAHYENQLHPETIRYPMKDITKVYDWFATGHGYVPQVNPKIWEALKKAEESLKKVAVSTPIEYNRQHIIEMAFDILNPKDEWKPETIAPGTPVKITNSNSTAYKQIGVIVQVLENSEVRIRLSDGEERNYSLWEFEILRNNMPETLSDKPWDEVIEKVKELRIKACEYDKIPVNSPFVVFSENNPFMKEYDEACGRLVRMQRLRRGDWKPDTASPFDDMHDLYVRAVNWEKDQNPSKVGEINKQNFTFSENNPFLKKYYEAAKKVRESGLFDKLYKALWEPETKASLDPMNFGAVAMEEYNSLNDAATFLSEEKARSFFNALISNGLEPSIETALRGKNSWTVIYEKPMSLDSTIGSLCQSIEEEKKAAEVYRNRAKMFENDNPTAAKLFNHIADEECCGEGSHYQELSKELARLKKQEYVADSAEYLASTITELGMREKLDKAFTDAIERVKGS